MNQINIQGGERWLLSIEIRICQLQLKSVHASYFEHADLGMSTSAIAKPERTHRQTHSMRFTESKGLGGIDDKETERILI